MTPLLKVLPPWAITLLGAVGAGIGYLLSPEGIGLLSPAWAHGLTAVGIVLSALGVSVDHIATRMNSNSVGAATTAATLTAIKNGHDQPNAPK